MKPPVYHRPTLNGGDELADMFFYFILLWS